MYTTMKVFEGLSALKLTESTCFLLLFLSCLSAENVFKKSLFSSLMHLLQIFNQNNIKWDVVFEKKMRLYLVEDQFCDFVDSYEGEICDRGILESTCRQKNIFEYDFKLSPIDLCVKLC